MSSNAIVPASVEAIVPRTLDETSAFSRFFVRSGFFKDSGDEAKCVVKILAGLEMGIKPFAAINGIHIINGKPVIGSGLMAQRLKESGKYDYRVKHHDTERCDLEFFELVANFPKRDRVSLGVESFTIEDARAAQLLGNQTWRKFPKNMLFSRCLSNGIRFRCPDAFSSAVYTPEEMGAEVNEDGDMVNPPFVPQATEPEYTEAEEVSVDEVVQTIPENQRSEWIMAFRKALAGTPAEAADKMDVWIDRSTKSKFPTLTNLLTTGELSAVEFFLQKAVDYGNSKRAEAKPADTEPQPSSSEPVPANVAPYRSAIATIARRLYGPEQRDEKLDLYLSGRFGEGKNIDNLTDNEAKDARKDLQKQLDALAGNKAPLTNPNVQKRSTDEPLLATQPQMRQLHAIAAKIWGKEDGHDKLKEYLEIESLKTLTMSAASDAIVALNERQQQQESEPVEGEVVATEGDAE